MVKSPRNERLAERMGVVARAARLRQAMTQSDVADSIGTVPAVYGRLERGDMLPSVPTLRRLCLALGESANTLLGLDELDLPPWLVLAREESGAFTQVRRLLNLAQRMDDVQLELMVEMARVLLKSQQARQAARNSKA
jgi:transcriptional regulator with XRE-family HTH domain